MEYLEGETLLYAGGGRKVILLNPTAHKVWELCDGRRTAGEIIGLLVRMFPDAPADIELMVSEFLQEAAGKGIIRWK